MVLSKPAVSILMPVYNCADYIADGIASILQQSFKDFELIIIDDGSSDASLLIAQGFALNDPRIKIHSLSHVGLVRALNYGIKICSGEYIARMDADDVAVSTRLELQLNQLNKVGADLCGGAIETFGTRKSIKSYPESHAGCVAMALFESPLAHPTVIGKSHLFQTLLYDIKMDKCEDYDLWVRAIKNGYKITNVREPVLMYRLHNNQVSKKYADLQNNCSKQVRKSIWAYLFPEICRVKQEQLVNEAFGDVEINALTPNFVNYVKSKSTLCLADDTFYYYVYKSYIKSRSNWKCICPNFIKITLSVNDSITRKLYYSISLCTAKILCIHSNSWNYNVLKRLHQILSYIMSRAR